MASLAKFTNCVQQTAKRQVKAIVVVCSMLLTNAWAELPMTKVLMSDARAPNDIRLMYKLNVITESLELTEEEYGPFELFINTGRMKNERAVRRLESGGAENIHFGLTSLELEQRLIPIRIPIRMGALNYRLLLIHKNDLEKFAQVKTLEQLKKLQVGLGAHWVTRKVLEPEGFKVIPSNTYEGLFKMLEMGRYDYTIRGPHEIYGELELFRDEAPNMVIEPTLALHIVAPFYIFVSPHEPVLAERIEKGLSNMVHSGRLREMFLDHYQDHIEKAQIPQRNIIHVPNRLLPNETPIGDDALWFWPAELNANQN
ncbi:transporter substrate-binding domain-containing protein [Neiella marina]|uniref:Transporter substrate-binding domain-containing protein n=1 Tax=Neiella holothuriorum TaxID=2870530 RepID=A0ABS7EFF4_9GAMM|nr:transporter substrate-binding domain-containing protein [Neiella holothuriorum]MBW8191053.1 transporter substrate-binding domain-containing protein [Neiella holothuriorum]